MFTLIVIFDGVGRIVAGVATVAAAKLSGCFDGLVKTTNVWPVCRFGDGICVRVGRVSSSITFGTLNVVIVPLLGFVARGMRDGVCEIDFPVTKFDGVAAPRMGARGSIRLLS